MDTNFVRVLQLNLHPRVCTTCLCLHRAGGEALCCPQKLSSKGMWGPQWSRATRHGINTGGTWWFCLGCAVQNCNFWSEWPLPQGPSVDLPHRSLVRKHPQIYRQVSLIREVWDLDYNTAEVPAGHCRQSWLLSLFPIIVNDCRAVPLFSPLAQGVGSHGPFSTL